MSKLKKRCYFVKILFPFQQLGGLYSQFEIPLDFKYLKDCEIFADKLMNILVEANSQTDQWLAPYVEIEETDLEKEEEAKTKNL